MLVLLLQPLVLFELVLVSFPPDAVLAVLSLRHCVLQSPIDAVQLNFPSLQLVDLFVHEFDESLAVEARHILIIKCITI